MNTSSVMGRRALGMVGGAARLASVDVLRKMHDANATARTFRPLNIAVECASNSGRRESDSCTAGSAEHQLRTFDAIRDFEQRDVPAVALPCFESHLFIDALQQNTHIAIVDMIAALFAHIRHRFPPGCRVGVLTSPVLCERRLFERYGERAGIEVVSVGVNSIGALRAACESLILQGVDLLLPGSTDSALSLRRIGELAVPVIDSFSVYAQHLLDADFRQPARQIKLGVVGGVGPAATVDFLHKVVRNTPAVRDQDHIKVIVEQNPQIPDRTDYLTGKGADPTLALYATCRKLEDGGADLIAIPCNTAHAFIASIEARLRIPIVNMMNVTADYLRATFPSVDRIGLLATEGTIASGVYHKALEARGMTEVLPPPALQARVTNAIYGARGVKAGYTSGECADDIIAAVESLLFQHVEVILLACTELPLLFPQAATVTRNGRTAQLVDPTDVLAKCCVEFARGQPLATQKARRREGPPVEYAARALRGDRKTALNADLLISAIAR
ncbi:aspartate/glutamate racemase family protein [Paraburkholderia sp. Tr-20389]|uniref:amino acid racemase n=1 Tax=Paraburkholderia sp. Tr-20389 TaxID=2703903 RepID=UPI0019815F01|nr:amino acid racemase [Paraburkholderia sp. Tr-20389]MBN3757098.1 aspartate/glutamate racemase family protein [Paraburkholderia sp. Tr-20389]